MHSTLNASSEKRSFNIFEIANPSFDTEQREMVKQLLEVLKTHVTKLVMQT